jgi:hypothetical protein
MVILFNKLIYNDKRILGLALAWILSWSIFAVDQLFNTYKYISLQNNMSSVALPGKTVIEKNGTKFMVDDKQVSNQIQAEQRDLCGEDKFWEEVELSISPKRKSLIVQFPEKISIKDSGIRSIFLQAIPKTSAYRSLGTSFHMHSLSQVKLKLSEESQEINLQLLDGLETEYSQVVDSWRIKIAVHSTKKDNCYVSEFLEINTSNYDNISNLNTFYESEILEPVFEDSFQHTEVNEQPYLENFFLLQKLKQLNPLLPEVHEAALALLSYTVWPEEDKYVISEIQNRHKLHDKVVFGLFGDVIDDDLKSVNKIIHVLNIIAPDLDISYSSKASEVNLPIHFAPCTELLSYYVNQCEGYAVGIYYHPSTFSEKARGKFGYIWIDSRYKSGFRQSVLIHEIGHALGLGHNLCTDSVMSYSDFRNEPEYFTAVDLMQLRLLYDKRLVNYEKAPSIMTKLNLDPLKYKEYKSDKSSMCFVKQSGWNDLINFQQGNISLQELKGNLNG